MKSTYVNCSKLSAAEVSAKIKQVKNRIATLQYIAGNRHYTKAHRYNAVIEEMVLGGQLAYLEMQLTQKQQAPAPRHTPAQSVVKPSNAPLKAKAKIHPELNPNLGIRHRLMSPKEKELLQRNKNMYSFLDGYTM